MDEETLQQEIRKFLRTFGVRANQEMADAIERARSEGRLDASHPIGVRARVEMEGLDDEIVVEGSLELE